jgi:peptidoglycan/LPS O-acetylase OafA/YrhL
MQYRPEIDGLRALAVVPVILSHAGFQAVSGGFVGVDIFFVISGYLITSIILAEKAANTFSLINFYERRARRILPALFVVLVICLPLAWLCLLPADLKNFSKSVIAVSTFTANFLFWRWSGYFDTASQLKPLLHTWTLAVEEQFYLFFPLFLMLLWRLAKSRIFIVLTVVALLSFGLGQYFSVSRPFFAFYLLPTRGWELLVGVLLAVWQNSACGNRRVSANTLSALSFVGLFAVLGSIFLFTKAVITPSFFTLIPTLGTALIIFGANQGNMVGKLLSAKAMVLIGLLSYSAYLWHQPLLAFARHRYGEPSEYLLIAIVLVTFLLSYLSYKFIETPVRNQKKFNREFIFKGAAICSAIFICIGLAGLLTNGFSQRFSIGDKEIAELDVFELSRYTDKVFLQHEHKNFEDNGKRKILLIGDSYSRDIANVVFESNLKDNLQLSTHHIAVLCGNLSQGFDLEKLIPKELLPGCVRDGWYEVAGIQRQLVEADEIWLASKWQPWVAQRLPESVEHLQRKYNKKIVVFGTKDFGAVSPKNLLKVPYSDRINTRQTVSKETEQVNLLMQKSLPSKVFINLLDIFCNPQNECSLFDEQGKLVSYDGTHLTVVGAKLLASKLENYRDLFKK